MSENGTVTLSVDPFTKAFITTWFKAVKDVFFFEDLDEFLCTTVREWTGPHRDLLTPELMSQFPRVEPI